MAAPTLYIFSGLPGSGKSTLAKALAGKVGAVYLRIDTVEQGLRDLCGITVEGEGYQLCYRVAADNLQLGTSVVADSCNPIQLSRDEWHSVAEKLAVRFIDIEVVCSDEAEHRYRVETRKPEVEGLQLPTWERVKKREYHPWCTERIVVDTAGLDVAETLQNLLPKIEAYSK